MTNYLFLFFSFIAFIACEPKTGVTEFNTPPATHSDNFNKSYWQDGKAEVSVFELSQNRYNAVHPGKMVNVFVLEDFLTDKQVKNERYENGNSVPVLKNIRSSKFTTGIYDYSLHTSVFTPLNQQLYATLKVTNTMQEWCGTTFLQLNEKENKYVLEQRSYFEKEGDRTVKLERVLVEDALMNQIRLDHTRLPIGEFDLISKLSYTALKHKPLKIYKARGERNSYEGDLFEGELLEEYRYTIKEQSRVVTFVYEGVSPFKIVGFTESYPSAFDGEIRTTNAKLTSVQRLAYWGMNSSEDVEIRNKIGL